MPVISVTESQVIDAAGGITDVYEIVYTIAGRPGAFTMQVPRDGDAVAAARQEIAELEAEVNAIYGL